MLTFKLASRSVFWINGRTVPSLFLFSVSLLTSMLPDSIDCSSLTALAFVVERLTLTYLLFANLLLSVTSPSCSADWSRMATILLLLSEYRVLSRLSFDVWFISLVDSPTVLNYRLLSTFS